MPTSVPPLQVHPDSPSEPAMLPSSAHSSSKDSPSPSLLSSVAAPATQGPEAIPSRVIERPGGSLSLKYHSDGEESDEEEEEVVPADRVGVILADKEARITHVNDFFSTLTGYSREESIGKNCSFLQGPATSREAIKTIRECLNHNQPCRVALINYRKDGGIFWNLLFISPVFNNSGGLDSYVGIQMNRQADFVDRPSPLFMWTRHRPRQSVISHVPHSSTHHSNALTRRAASTPPALPAPSSALLACPSFESEGQRTLSSDSPSATPRPASAASLEGPAAVASKASDSCSYSSCDCGRAPTPSASHPQIAPASSAPTQVPQASAESASPTEPDRTPIAKPPISFIAETLLPTKKGNFRVLAFKDQLSGSEIMCIASGAVEGTSSLPVRVHDQCFTAEVFGSLKCDCKEQLDYAMEYIQSKGLGMVIYLQQEGRGIGLANKIKAYSLQERGYDTVEANTVLGFGAEERQYAVVLSVLEALNISSIRLMTNNPMKVQTLQSLGVDVTGRVPVLIESNPHSAKYLHVKQHSMGHMLQ